MLMATLSLSGDRTQRPDKHVAMFASEIPCESQGRPLAKIINSSSVQSLGGGLVVNHSFSSKPKVGHYADYYEKMTTYAAILANEAGAIDPEATPRTRRVVANDDPESPFVYLDTARSEEHTSELQSLMRISYAVFCLKQKTQSNPHM